MATTIWNVQGMHCDHCVRAVTEEVAALPAVTHVEVHLDTGRVDIDSKAPVDREELAAAIERAGYELVE